jgi:hypothetical protein
LVVLVAFGAGIVRLFGLQFSTGDLYPDYSTLNAGPKGARALFESLEQVRGLAVERNYVPLLQVKDFAGATLVIAGAGGAFLGADTPANFEKFESMMVAGCDVIVTLAAVNMPAWTEHKVDAPMKDPWRPWRERHPPADGKNPPVGEPPLDKDGEVAENSDGAESQTRSDQSSDSGGGRNGDEEEEEDVVAAERWQFSFLKAVDKKDQPAAGWTVEAPEGVPNPPAFPQWFSAWRFIGEAESWETLAQAGGRPVIIRRRFGDGSLTLVSDSAFLSNEALWRAPKPGFLLWLFAGRPRVIFDETHHGTVSSPGVMFLIRRYRLLGFFCGAAILLSLFVWRASSQLAPAAESPGGATGRIEGAESLGGFRDLMRQNVDRRSLLATCCAEWAKSPFVRRRYGGARIEALRAIIDSVKTRRSAPVVEAYRAAARSLRRH